MNVVCLKGNPVDCNCTPMRTIVSHLNAFNLRTVNVCARLSIYRPSVVYSEVLSSSSDSSSPMCGDFLFRVFSSSPHSDTDD
jgi:hypothetical protein